MRQTNIGWMAPLLFVAACGSDSESTPAVNDAGSDTPVDATVDGQAGGGNDATTDSTSDATQDVSPEGDADAPSDGASDTMFEGGPDSDAADGQIEGGNVDAAPGPVQLLDDNRFLEGFNTYPVDPSTTPIGTLIPPTATDTPVWRLAEWHSAQLLTIGPPTMTQWGAQWANAYKRVVISDGFLELAVNAEAEYGGVYRQQGEPWPHLLVAQQIFNDSASQPNTPIHQYESITLSLNLELVYANHINEAGYDPSLHACQFLMFITLQNRNKNNDDYGNFIWFGLPFYDDRYATLDENVAIDSGTGKYMFRMASDNFMPASLHDVSNVSVSVDLLPYMKSSVEDAIAQGILASPNLNDYYLGGMNMGFEVPGRSVATMRVRDLSLLATTP